MKYLVLLACLLVSPVLLQPIGNDSCAAEFNKFSQAMDTNSRLGSIQDSYLTAKRFVRRFFGDEVPWDHLEEFRFTTTDIFRYINGTQTVQQYIVERVLGYHSFSRTLKEAIYENSRRNHTFHFRPQFRSFMDAQQLWDYELSRASKSLNLEKVDQVNLFL